MIFKWVLFNDFQLMLLQDLHFYRYFFGIKERSLHRNGMTAIPKSNKAVSYTIIYILDVQTVQL